MWRLWCVLDEFGEWTKVNSQTYSGVIGNYTEDACYCVFYLLQRGFAEDGKHGISLWKALVLCSSQRIESKEARSKKRETRRPTAYSTHIRAKLWASAWNANLQLWNKHSSAQIRVCKILGLGCNCNIWITFHKQGLACSGQTDNQTKGFSKKVIDKKGVDCEG